MYDEVDRGFGLIDLDGQRMLQKTGITRTCAIAHPQCAEF